MSNSEIYEWAKQYLRGESSLEELRRWVVSARLPLLLQEEGSPEYELTSLLLHSFFEYDIDRDKEELAKTLRRFLNAKKVAISP